MPGFGPINPMLWNLDPTRGRGIISPSPMPNPRQNMGEASAETPFQSDAMNKQRIGNRMSGGGEDRRNRMMNMMQRAMGPRMPGGAAPLSMGNFAPGPMAPPSMGMNPFQRAMGGFMPNRPAMGDPRMI